MKIAGKSVPFSVIQPFIVATKPVSHSVAVPVDSEWLDLRQGSEPKLNFAMHILFGVC